MGEVRGESRDQGALFQVYLEVSIPADRLSQVIDAFAARSRPVRLRKGLARCCRSPASRSFSIAPTLARVLEGLPPRAPRNKKHLLR